MINFFARNKWTYRVMGVLFGVVLVLLGITSYLEGKPGHRNYWKGLVTYESAIAIGSLAIVVACLPGRLLERKAVKPKSRRERLTARKALNKRTRD